MSKYIFDLNNVYSFTTKAPGLLNLRYEKVKLVSILNYEQALKVENISGLWASIYPLLTNDGANVIQNNPNAYNYYNFNIGANVYFPIAEPWVNVNSIKLVESIVLNINLYGLDSMSDVSDIIDTLKSSGYTNFTTETTIPS